MYNPLQMLTTVLVSDYITTSLFISASRKSIIQVCDVYLSDLQELNLLLLLNRPHQNLTETKHGSV